MNENVLTITTADKTPLVEALLKKLQERDELIDRLYARIEKLEEENKALKDEIKALKKSPKRPKIKSNKKNKSVMQNLETLPKSEKRPGSEKKSKKIEIHEIKVLKPENIPDGSKLKRTRNFDEQDLRIVVHNTRYALEEWETPEGNILSAQMPAGVSQGHFGNELCSFILDQHHQCQVTQPLLHEQLTEFGIDISTGQLNNILIENKDLFHQEKNEILKSGLKVSSYIQVDDTGARHDGKNGYCTQIGNEFFAWFQSTESKSRINFLQILNAAYPAAGYLLDANALKYMVDEGLPKEPLLKLASSIKKNFQSSNEWYKWLQESKISNKNHIKIATEGALLAGALNGGLNSDLAILSDDAGQFNIPFLTHALCWIHEERHIKNLIPMTELNIPLHNNGSETDIRDYVKRRKVSGGTRSLAGQKSRDTFTSLKKTCRKLGLSFYSYLKDRLSGAYKIAKLGFLIEQAAANKVTPLQISEIAVA